MDKKNKSILQEMLRSDGFITTAKCLIKTIGFIDAGILSNYMDKSIYFQEQDAKNKGWFYLTLEAQHEELGIPKNRLIRAKNFFIYAGVLKVQRKGIPSKEWFLLDFEAITDLITDVEKTKQLVLNFQEEKRLHKQQNSVLTVQRNKPQKKLEASLKKSRRLYINNKDKSNDLSNKNKNKNEISKDISVRPARSDGEISKSFSKKSFSNGSIKRTIPPRSQRQEVTQIRKKVPPKEQNQFIPLAQNLADIIQTKKKIRHTPKQISSWACEFQRLEKSGGVSVQRMQTCLDWYAEHIGEPFTPVIESGRSFRDKFLRLEDAVERSKRPSPPPKQQGVTQGSGLRVAVPLKKGKEYNWDTEQWEDVV